QLHFLDSLVHVRATILTVFRQPVNRGDRVATMEGIASGNWRPYAARIVAIAAVYYGAAKLGLDLAFAAPSVTAVWPPTGIALAAVVLFGYRTWAGAALRSTRATSAVSGAPGGPATGEVISSSPRPCSWRSRNGPSGERRAARSRRSRWRCRSRRSPPWHSRARPGSPTSSSRR